MKCIFIYNPKSGKGKIAAHLNYIITELNKKFEQVDIHETISGEDAIKCAKESCALYDVIIFSGGDGTFNDITCGVASQEKRPILGYIPSGTVNDIARNLKIPRNIKRAIKIILEGETVKHDVGLINDTYFMYVVAIGTFTGVSYRTKHDTKKMFGRLAYAFDGLKDLLNPSLSRITLKTESGIIIQESPLVLVLNSISVGGIPFNKNGHLNDGKFDVLLVKKDLTRGLFNIAKLFIMGLLKIRRKKYVTHVKASSIDIILKNDPIWCVDGEEGPRGSVHIQNLHNHLTIYIPKKRNKKTKSKNFN